MIEYNNIIKTVAAEQSLPLVDIWSLHNSFFNEGFAVGGVEYTRDYLNLALLQTPPGDGEWTQRIEQALATVAREK